MKQICLVFIVAFLSGCFGKEPQKTGKEGKSLPEFSMLLTDSTTWLHSRDIPTNKPFILFIFSPYCPFCQVQTKKIIEDKDMFKNVHFYFISHYPLSSIKAYIKEFQLENQSNITVGLDSAQFVYDYFEVPAYPYIAIYGKDKKLNAAFIGKTYSRQLLEAAEK